MCKWIQDCWETCYWNLIEERFCFDESIANYQDTITKEEKNNNLFDNMAFYDSVSVIAGRSIVTIDPLPEKKKNQSLTTTIVEQPRRLKKDEKIRFENGENKRKKNSCDSLETLSEENDKENQHHNNNEKQQELEEEVRLIKNVRPRHAFIKKTVSFLNIPNSKLEQDDLDDSGSKSDNSLSNQVELRKKSLKERRMSKSLSLKIDHPQEIPIIRQSSVPKFFLDTPEENQTESSLIRTPLTALRSPLMSDNDGFVFDLKSVVQIENSKKKNFNNNSGKDGGATSASVHRESSKLSQMKRSIKLKKSKSTVCATNLPHTNYI